MKRELGSLSRQASVGKRTTPVRKSGGLESQHGTPQRFGCAAKNVSQALLMVDSLLIPHRLVACGLRLTMWAYCIYPQAWALLKLAYWGQQPNSFQVRHHYYQRQSVSASSHAPECLQVFRDPQGPQYRYSHLDIAPGRELMSGRLYR